MNPSLSMVEIWQIAVVRLLFYVFIAAGLVIFFKFKKTAALVMLISLFLGATYAVMIQASHVLWWGLQGDEIFVGAFLERVASGQFFSDFFYASLPPFYPPLYFWLVGGLGWILGTNGIGAAHLGVLLTLMLTPLITYWWQVRYWTKHDEQPMERWRIAVTTAAVFVVADWSAVIFKPYEFISAVLICFWTVFLFQDLQRQRFGVWRILSYGVSGGLLLMTFYFWFFPAVLAAVLFKLTAPDAIRGYWLRLAMVLITVAVVSLPFTAPLAVAYLQLGAENMQPAFFIPEDLNLFSPFLNFSAAGALSLAGLFTIAWYWRRPYVRALGALLAATYLWQLLNVVALAVDQSSLLPSKPFLFLATAVLMIAAGYGIGEAVSSRVRRPEQRAGLFVVGLVLLAAQLPGGSFIDDPAVRQRLVAMKQPLPEEIGQVVEKLSQVNDLKDLTILSSGIPQISAYLPLNYYISYNVHFSHPAAHFSERYAFVADLGRSASAAEFYQKLKRSPFEPIDALLLFKGEGSYPFLFWLDDYPHGAAENQIDVPADLIDRQYFDTIFEDKHFVFLRVK